MVRVGAGAASRVAPDKGFCRVRRGTARRRPGGRISRPAGAVAVQQPPARRARAPCRSPCVSLGRARPPPRIVGPAGPRRPPPSPPPPTPQTPPPPPPPPHL